MPAGEKLFDLVRKPLPRDELESFLRNMTSIPPRYSVTRGTLLQDMWSAWFCERETSTPTRGGIGGLIDPTNRLLGISVNGNPQQNVRNWFPVGQKRAGDAKTSEPLLHAAEITARTLVMWRGGKLPCNSAKQCPKVNDWGAIDPPARKISHCELTCRDSAHLAESVVEFLRGHDGANGKIWIRDALGISASSLVSHLRQGRKHLLIPVEPKSVANWHPDEFLETFSHLKPYLETAKRENLRLTYVLQPEPRMSTNHQESWFRELAVWLRGEYRYRSAMEYLVRRNWVEADGSIIQWLVKDDSNRDRITDTLFPDTKWERWQEELKSKFGRLNSWTFCSYVASANIVRENVEFAVTPIAKKMPSEPEPLDGDNNDLVRRYREPALPVVPPDAGQLSQVVVECIRTALGPKLRKPPTGWRILNIQQFLALPGDKRRYGSA